MTTIVKTADGRGARGYDSSLNKLIGRTPDGTEVFPTGDVRVKSGTTYVEVMNTNVYKDADGWYTAPTVYILDADLEVVGTEPPPEGELISIPVGEASIVVKSGLLAGTYDSVIETLWRKRAG